MLSACPKARFVVVGGDAAEIRRMNEALDRAGIAESVCFPGRIETTELAALLSISDVLVSPRRAGVTAPIKVLDYLKSGTPIVAADTPANRAILSSENAVITRAVPTEFAAGILRLCNNPRLGAELARQGRETLRREQRSPLAFRQALNQCYAYVLSTT
ncbi:MAG TPA: glycosyltransferase [Kiritimatiellia bacterium]|nr:glycosyltransferase [Kiritimatiellia bacterium]HRU70231.1 glycosyltransferase [Kiritimatiellia bacterium]